MPGWFRAATVAASRWKRWRKLGSLEYWSERTLIATGISRRGWGERYTTPIAPRPSSASIGERPNCVVLTFGSMGLSVCPTEPRFPSPLAGEGDPACAASPVGWGRGLGKDAQRQIERHAPVRLVDDLTDVQVPGEAAEDVRVLAAQPVVPDQPLDREPHRVAGILHEVGPQRAHRVITCCVAPWLEWRRRRHEVIAPGSWRPALDHSKPE